MAKEKSILYFMGTWAVGGVERVTAELANEWIRRGWRVSVFAFTMENDLLRKELSDQVTFVVPNAGVMTDASAAALRRVIVEQKVAYVVNDWCLPFRTTRFLRRVCKGLDVKQIACLHNMPNHNARIAGARNPLVRALYRVASQANMFLAYLFCDRYVVLSESFKPIFRRFACVPFARRLDAIGNPLTICPPPRAHVRRRTSSSTSDDSRRSRRSSPASPRCGRTNLRTPFPTGGLRSSATGPTAPPTRRRSPACRASSSMASRIPRRSTRRRRFS